MIGLHDLIQNQVLVGLSGATIIGALLYVCRQAPRTLWRAFLDQFSIHFETRSTDASFHWVVSWLSAHPYSKRARNFLLSATRDQVESAEDKDEDSNTPRYILSPGPGVHLLMVQNRPVLLTRAKEDSNKNVGNPRDIETLSFRVLGRDRAILDKVIEETIKHVYKEAKKSVAVHMHQDEYWYVGIRQPLRNIESVVLADGIMEVLLDDIKLFCSQGEWYLERGIPWRRGYELYGPPGCGKSSLVSALASHLGMGVSMLNLSGVANDGDLVYLLRSQPHNTILLVEDVDAAFKERTAKDAKITFSSFLNAIDGLAAPNGRILFMTTNHPELLDPALVRPGRIDMPIEIGLATANQGARMYVQFYGKEREANANAFGRHVEGMSPADIQKLMMEHRDSPDTALRVVSHRMQIVA